MNIGDEIREYKIRAREAIRYAKEFRREVAVLESLTIKDEEKQFAIEAFSQSIIEEWLLASSIWLDITKLTKEDSALGMVARIGAITCALNGGEKALAFRTLLQMKRGRLIGKELAIEMLRVLNIGYADEFGPHEWWT